MSFEQSLFLALLSFAYAAITAFAVRRWRASKADTSIFAQDEDVSEIVFSALSSLFSAEPVNPGQGRVELRPTRGVRLLAPPFAIVIVALTDLGPLWSSVGLDSGGLPDPVQGGIVALFGYSWFMMLFVQRVIYDSAHIVCHGVALRPQTRHLWDLVDIKVHDTRPALVLTFARQPPLYVPKFLSHRETFISAMKAIAQDNARFGLRPRETRVQDRLGF